MKFDANCALSLPFSTEQEAIERNFLRWSHDKLEMPLDIMLNSRLLEIKKVYLPIRNFCDINYIAEWKARSYWTHSESYTEYESKIVYLDKMGREYSTPLSAELFYGSDYKAQAISKVVPVTKFKTIIDDIRETTGIVKGTSPQSYVDYNPDKSDEFKAWIRKIRKDHSKEFEKYKPVEKCTILELSGTDGEAFSSIRSKLHSKADALCKEKIPGDRYENFEILKFDCDYTVGVVLLPLFQIKYSYQNQEYEYFVNGTNADDIYIEKYPIDEGFAVTNDKLTNEIQKGEKLENTYFILAIVCFVLGGVFSVLGIGVILVPVLLIGWITFWIFYKRTKKKGQRLLEQLETLNSKRVNERCDFNQKYKGASSEKKKNNPNFCDNCGNKILPNARFCVRCGKKIK